MNKNNFLETVKVGKLLRMFAIPCVISLVVQALYNIVDQIFIGFTSGLGELGNTATGIVYPLTVIALAVALLLGDGIATKLSINQGQNNNQYNSKTVAANLTCGLIISLIIMTVGLVWIEPILRGLGANQVILPYAKNYATFILLGFPLFIMGTILNPIIRADGSPKYAMFVMIAGAVTNIILDPIFLFGCQLGMQGAALATFLGQLVTFLLSVAYLFKAKTFKIKFADFLPNGKLFCNVTKLGISSFLTQISIVIVSVVNNNLIANLLPTDNSAIGMLTIAFKVFGIVVSIIVGIACGGQPIIGYNYGARRFDRVKQTLRYIMTIALSVGVVATVLFVCFPQQIYMIFGYSNVSSFGVKCFQIYMCMILLTCFTKATAIFFQAVEKPVKSTLIAMCGDLLFLIPLSLILYNFGVDAFLWSAPISNILTAMLTIVLLIIVLKDFTKVTKNITTATTTIQASQPGLIITISREHGAGGREIAFELAKKLNIPCYDKELTSLMAQDSGLAVDYLNQLEKNVAQPMYDLYLSKTPTTLATDAQQNVLKAIAEKGACVILGRCADYILKDYKPYRIFIYADKAYKQQRIANNYHDDENTAYANITKSDEQRAKFYQATTGQVWGAKENYDLYINGSVGVQKAVAQIYHCIQNR